MKKITAMLLVFVSIFIGCSCSKISDTSDGSADDTSKSVSDGTTNYDELLPNENYDGYEFRILTDQGYFMDYAEQNGETVQDAVYLRNRIAEDKLNINISDVAVADVPTTVKNDVTAGDDSFDCCSILYCDMCTQFIASDYLLNLNKISTLDLKQEWWDQNMYNSMSIDGNIKMMVGDLIPPMGTVCVIFNKTLWNTLSLDNPYEMVNKGTWTLDTMKKIAEGATVDLNGDSALTQEDQWGIISDNNFAHSFYFGSGERMVSTDSDGIPTITFNSERSTDIVAKIINLLTDGAAVIRVDYIDGSYEYRDSMFMENRALMSASSFGDVLRYRNMDADFGILPVPKYDEAQEKYYCWGNIYIYTLAVPTTQPDPERTGTILETLAILSKEKLTPAIYDILLEGKVTRDTESNDMITLINSSRVYDLGIVCDLGGFRTLLSSLAAEGSTDFASAYAKAEQKATADLEKIVDYYEMN